MGGCPGESRDSPLLHSSAEEAAGPLSRPADGLSPLFALPPQPPPTRFLPPRPHLPPRVPPFPPFSRSLHSPLFKFPGD